MENINELVEKIVTLDSNGIEDLLSDYSLDVVERVLVEVGKVDRERVGIINLIIRERVHNLRRFDSSVRSGEFGFVLDHLSLTKLHALYKDFKPADADNDQIYGIYKEIIKEAIDAKEIKETEREHKKTN